MAYPLLILPLALLLFALHGCEQKPSHPYEGFFSYRNNSDQKIWVEDLQGFETALTCGNLVPNGNAFMATYRPMPIPDECQIEWWPLEPEYEYSSEGESQKQTQIVDLRSAPTNFSGTIEFQFNTDSGWKAVFQP